MSGYDRTPGRPTEAVESAERVSPRYDSRASDVAPTPGAITPPCAPTRFDALAGRSEADRCRDADDRTGRMVARMQDRGGVGALLSGKSAAFRRDSSLAGFIKRLRDVGSIRRRLGKIRRVDKMPGDLEAFKSGRRGSALRGRDERSASLLRFSHAIVSYPCIPSLVIRSLPGAGRSWWEFQADVQGVEVQSGYIDEFQ